MIPYLLPHLLDRAAEQWPDKDAFSFFGEGISYADLLRKSNSLANFLVANGVQRGDRVGIYLHKSLECAIAMYGIFKAGAAYVPLDPGAPTARINLLLNDCGIRHLISQPQKRHDLPEVVKETAVHTLIGVNTSPVKQIQAVGWQEVFTYDGTAAPEVGLMGHDLAYIIYTSGSTGTPKGIMHTHASGLSLARLSADTYGLTENDRLGNFAPLHFDQSTFDFFCAPLVGGTTVIIPEEYKMLPASLSELVEEERLTVWYSVPLALTQMLLRGQLAERDWSTMRWILFGGEPFTPKYLQQLQALLPHVRFSNVYGPAEVNQCTYFHVPPLPNPYGEEPLPIGHIWGDTQGLIVDGDDNIVTEGDVGELLIRSTTMMAGYWNQPELTERSLYRQTRFANFEEMFYRTGDLVRQTPDGLLQFLGRKDRQVKIRGFRVELDEVETAISSHARVEETAVFPQPNPIEGGKQITAVLIAKPNATLTEQAIRDHLAPLLPSYAIPTAICFTADFPRTSSGKIDRRTLQAQFSATQPVTFAE